MFNISRVKLHNICQYDDADVPIEGGLTAVCGRNGMGKTSFLRALAYGLTGLVDGSWGTQQNLQKDGTVDPGWVEVHISGSDNLVIRRFSTSSTKFPDRVLRTVNGVVSEVAVRRKEVDRYMNTVFGIPVALMFQIMWGRQGRLDDLLTSPPALVNTFLASVFDTKRLDKIREKLKLQIDTIANVPSDSVELLERYKKERDQLPDLYQLRKSLDEEKVLLDVIKKELSHATSIKSTGMSKSELENLKQKHAEFIRYSEEWLGANPVTETPLKPAIPIEDIIDSIASTTEQLNSIKASITAKENDIKQLTYEVQAYSASLDDLRTKHVEILDKMSTHDTVCRLCKGHIVDHDSYDMERWMLLTGYPTRASYEAAFTSSEHDLFDAIKQRKAAIESSKELIVQLEQSSKSQEELLGNLSLLKEQYEAYVAWENTNDMRKMHEDRIRTAKEALLKLQDRVPLDDDIDDRIREMTSRAEAQTRKVDECSKLLFKTEADLAYYDRSIQDYEKAAQVYRINSEAKHALVTIRDILSQGRAQARYMRSKIQQLNTRISAYMEQTGMPFSLYLNENTHVFEYKTSSGFVHPASHLSGAQKSISSVVLQMAMLSVIGPQMNLFLVDEPSEALDDENKIVMADLFQRLNNLLPSMDGVMLIVTRDTLIIESCENVINVGD